MSDRLPPAQVKIGGQTWRVVVGGAIEGDEDSPGTCQPRELRISLNIEQFPQDVVRETFLHELMHAIISNLSVLGLTDPVEERIVSSVAPWLFAALVDNADTVRYLSGLD